MNIGNICFTSLAVIGGKLFSNHQKIGTMFIKTKSNCYHIITLEKNVSGGDNFLKCN